MTKLSSIDTSVWYPVTVPSTGKKTKFRPFKVREERALLTAQQSEEPAVMMNTVESIVKACVEKCPTDLTVFDAEYLFIMARAKSVGEVADVVLTCKKCGADQKTGIDITQVKVEGLADSKKLKLSDKLTVIMKYPCIDQVSELMSAETNKDVLAISASIETVYFGDEVIHVKESDPADIVEFILNRTDEELAPMVTFIEKLPYVVLEHSMTCKTCHNENDYRITGVANFFE